MPGNHLSLLKAGKIIFWDLIHPSFVKRSEADRSFEDACT
jgi:hypothetical protein